MFENFAERFNGHVVDVQYCEMDDLWLGRVRRPSCDGHATIAVPADEYAAAWEAAYQFNEDARNWASIEVIKE